MFGLKFWSITIKTESEIYWLLAQKLGFAETKIKANIA